MLHLKSLCKQKNLQSLDIMTNCKVIDKKTWCDILSRYCLKCISRHLSCDWKLVIGDDETIFLYLKEHYSLDMLWSSFQKDDKLSDSDNINCLACSGILSSKFMQHCVSLIKNCISCEKFEFSSFKLLIFMPLSLLIQESGTLLMFKNIFDEHVVKDPFNVKELFKAMLEPSLVESLNADRKIDSEFEISLYIKNCHADEIVLPQLKVASPGSFESRKKKRFHKQQKVGESKITSAQIKSALSKIEESEVKRIHSLMIGPCQASVCLNHLSVFVGGRYNKYSRRLPQTPWIIDGEKKFGGSVEEYLAGPLQLAFHADDHHFASSGREDVDVRMLGNGRPFVLELVNPRLSMLSGSELQELEATINNQSTDVAVSSLQVLKKSDCKLIKEGEAEKTKSYTALCCFIDLPTQEQLDKLLSLSEFKDIQLNQCTPIRVLHRRPAATRLKVVHSMAAERIPDDSRLFRLNMVTQAGTYIKEFVHGDFGRTSPSLKDFLGAEVDIIELDVTWVNVKWPP